MPELPEVQTIVDALTASGLEGKRITHARVHWSSTIATPSKVLFCRRIKYKQIQSIRRRGKLIVMHLGDRLHLVVHLRMTGRFELAALKTDRTPHVHVVLELNDDRQLMFHDTRKFGRFYLTESVGDIIGRLGPEPLGKSFTSKSFGQMLTRRRRQIKSLLLDQGFLAGLGNIYVDEALWASKIHPRRLANSLDADEVRSLHRSIRQVLRRAIDNAGTSLGDGLGNFAWLNQQRGRNSNALKVFRRTGQACMRCGQAIERIVVAQRGTHICTKCQE